MSSIRYQEEGAIGDVRLAERRGYGKRGAVKPADTVMLLGIRWCYESGQAAVTR